MWRAYDGFPGRAMQAMKTMMGLSHKPCYVLWHGLPTGPELVCHTDIHAQSCPSLPLISEFFVLFPLYRVLCFRCRRAYLSSCPLKTNADCSRTKGLKPLAGATYVVCETVDLFTDTFHHGSDRYPLRPLPVKIAKSMMIRKSCHNENMPSYSQVKKQDIT